MNEELLLTPLAAVPHRRRHLLVQHVVVGLQLTLHTTAVDLFRSVFGGRTLGFESQVFFFQIKQSLSNDR